MAALILQNVSGARAMPKHNLVGMKYFTRPGFPAEHAAALQRCRLRSTLGGVERAV